MRWRTDDAARRSDDGALYLAGPPLRNGSRSVQTEEMFMHGALKAFSYVVLVLMAVGIVYASYIGIKYWTGISV